MADDKLTLRPAFQADMQNPTPQVLNRVQRVCDRLDISESFFWSCAKAGLIKTVYVGASPRVSEDELQRIGREGLKTEVRGNAK